MSVKETNLIDGMGIEESTATLVLLAADPYPWELQLTDHLRTAQEKINQYVEFLQTGAFREKYPDKRLKGFRIEYVMKYPCPEKAVSFFEAGKAQLREIHIDFDYSVRAEEEPKA